MGHSTVQLLTFGFGADAEYEGQFVGALERLESGGALKVLDALFVHRDAETGELEVVNVRGDGAGGIAGPLVDFRLDAGARRRATQKALAGRPGGIEPDAVQQLGAGLDPGGALAAVLVEHTWRRALDDAVERSGGKLLVSEFVAAARLAELDAGALAAGR